jgi:hypothetical protein
LAFIFEISIRHAFHVGWHNLTDPASRVLASSVLLTHSPIRHAQIPIRHALTDIDALSLPSLYGFIPLVDIVLASPKAPNAYAFSFGPFCIIGHRLGPDAESFITPHMISFGIDDAHLASIRFATAHEAAHCSFANLGSRDAMLALVHSQLVFHPQTPPALRQKVSDWVLRACNESYADLIAVALAARTQPPHAFHLFTSSLIGLRFAHHSESMHRSIMHSTPPHLDFDQLDVHATHPALAQALRMDQTTMARLSGRALEQWALDTSLRSLCAHLRLSVSFLTPHLMPPAL